MNFALIPTRKTPSIDSDLPIGRYLRDAGWNVVYLEDENSIFDAYSNGIGQVVRPNDKVILCHDDITVLTDKKIFNHIIESNLSNPKTGFIGVAGTQFLGANGVWWDGLPNSNPNSPSTNPLCGMVYHGESIDSCQPTFYGMHRNVVALDGVFLAATGKTLTSIKTSMPKEFTGGWDFYDIYYTFQAHKRGLTNRCVPINILHGSIGQLKEGWHKNRKAFTEKYKDSLPCVIE